MPDALGKVGSGTAPVVAVVRHGHTLLNGESGTSDERIRAWSDVPLDNRGRQQAFDLAERLHDFPAQRLVASDLQRAQETARIIGAATGLQPETDPRLRPWNLGQLTGRPVSSSLSALEHYQSHPDEAVPGGESYNAFYQRWAGALQDALSRQQPAIMVAHSRNLLALPSILSGGRAPIDPKGGPDPGRGYLITPTGLQEL